MEYEAMSVAATIRFSSRVTGHQSPLFIPRCCESKSSRGFGRQPSRKENKAPALTSRPGGNSYNIALDRQFDERIESVRRSAAEQKKANKIKEYGPIDYDAPVESEKKTIGLGLKFGVGVAVVVFGLVFAAGDFLPSESINPSEVAQMENDKLSKEDRASLESRLQQFEATLAVSPEDSDALEGAAVSLAELGKYSQAASHLEELTKKKPSDPNVFRLLGEVKYELKDYEGSAMSFKSSAAVSRATNFDVLRGLTNALLAAKKPDEAVDILLSSREHLNMERSMYAKSESAETKRELEVDPIQVELLLGKAYSDWGHVNDAITVYDQLISSHPNDFRGYLAKGIILKNRKAGDAERMFIQARFFAPEKAKPLIDRYSRR